MIGRGIESMLVSTKKFRNAKTELFRDELTEQLYSHETTLERMQKATKMVHYLKNALVFDIKNATWMDESTRLSALKKAKRMIPFVGNPEIIPEPMEFGQCSNDSFFRFPFDKFISSRRFDWKYAEEHGREGWLIGYDFLIVNAYYYPQLNVFVLPSSITGFPFFDVDAPMSFNFGGLGAVSGHEISQ